MRTRLLLNTLPLLVIAVLALLALALHFNGLYGQDAHEYLRQSHALFGRLCGQSYLPESPGDREFGGGYPLAGAMLQFLGVDSIVALQAISILSAGAVLWLFEQLLRLLAPGANGRSRLLYAGLLLALTPALIRAGLTVMSDALGLALMMAALWQGLRVIELNRPQAAVSAAILGGWAVTTRFAAAGLLLPLAGVVAWRLIQKKKWGWLIAAGLFGSLAMLLHFWLKNGVETTALQHSLLQEWSPVHFFQRTFQTLNGTVRYTLPNGLYLFFPLAHPAFCLPLPGLFFLVKRTDFYLFSKKTLLACLVAYLLLLSGLPHQNVRYLLPAFVIVLLLLFPAWDRLVSYGLLYFKRLTLGFLAVIPATLLVGNAFFLAPVLARNRLETALAAELRPMLPCGSRLFAFDVDIALRSYLPDVQMQNLWVRRYDDFPEGSFLLFNEPALREQWAGQNPMLNWEHARRDFRLEEKKALPGGWVLYEIGTMNNDQ